MRTLSTLQLSLLSASAAAALALVGLSGCTVEARPDHVRYSQAQPVYQETPIYQQPTYQAPPPPQVVYRAPPPIVVEEHHDHGFDRRPIMDALGHLRAADSQIVPNHLEPSKESLRAARDALRHSARDPRVDDALKRVDAALDAAEHSRPRIEQDHIREAIAILHKGWEGDRR